MNNSFRKHGEKNLGLTKVLKRKSEKISVKWKGYDNLYNSWVNKYNVLNI